MIIKVEAIVREEKAEDVIAALDLNLHTRTH